jgi:hypothetical protein
MRVSVQKFQPKGAGLASSQIQNARRKGRENRASRGRASPAPASGHGTLSAGKRVVSKEGWDYDWATYDLFPFFKGDFRPMADTLERLAYQRDPHDACDDAPVSLARRIVMSPLYGLSLFLRVFPVMNTNPEESHTLGNLDPPRGPTAAFNNFSGRPFGTTHELVGLAPALDRSKRKRDDTGVREIPIGYDEVVSPLADCPIARSWLLQARKKTIAYGDNPNGLNWDSERAGANAPASRFRHGFKSAGISPITRANDPFWNMRAFDTALVRHDCYMLFIYLRDESVGYG